MLDKLILNIKEGDIPFSEVLNYIDEQYHFTPSAFKNGSLENAVDQNHGSCKIFAFAQLNQLNEADTLTLFAEHYENVVQDADGTNHQNIRQFIQHGWNGISFNAFPLKAK